MTTKLFQPPTAAVIEKCMAQLAVAFQRHIDVATVRVYRETLSDLPEWAIEAAALTLRRNGGTFFPPAPVWHRVAEDMVADRSRAVLTQRRTQDGYECEHCRDTGWCDVDRDGRNVCIPCSCRATNANYRRLTASSRKDA